MMQARSIKQPNKLAVMLATEREREGYQRGNRYKVFLTLALVYKVAYPFTSQSIMDSVTLLLLPLTCADLPLLSLHN